MLGQGRSCFERCLISHAIEPVADHFSRRDRRRPANEDEEGSLKRIFGIVMVAEKTAADAPDHPAVPPYQSGGGSFVALFDEAIQQLSVAQPRTVSLQHDLAEML